MAKLLERLRKGDIVKVRISLAGTGIPREEHLRKGSVGAIEKENFDGTYQVEFPRSGNYITMNRGELTHLPPRNIKRDRYGHIVIK